MTALKTIAKTSAESLRRPLGWLRDKYHVLSRQRWFCYTTQFINAIYLFSPCIFFMVAYYFIIVNLPLGEDMLMQAGEAINAALFTCATIVAWTLFSWFSSRLVADAKTTGITDPRDTLFYRHLPRLLGYNVPVSLQLAILNLPSNMVLKGVWPVVGFFAVHNLFYLLLIFILDKRRWWLVLIALTAAGYYLWRWLQLLRDDDIQVYGNHLQTLYLLAICFFVFQLVFVWAVHTRRAAIDRGWANESGVLWHAVYALFYATCLATYIVIVTYPSVAVEFGGLACAILAFGLWVGLIYLVRYFGIRLRVKFGLIILLWAIFLGKCSDPYEVRVHESDQDVYAQRPTVDTFLNRWFMHPDRKEKIMNGNDYPVYLVMCDGGASKSGYWVASVLSKLEKEKPGARFSSHVLSLAGASGGSVGNAAFYAMLREAPHPRDSFFIESRRFFDTDLLSHTLSHYLGLDLVRHLFPFRATDRAAALEESMETARGEVIRRYFGKPLSQVLDYSGKLPLLFINTTNLQTGGPGVVSTVQFDSTFSSRLDVLTLLGPYRYDSSCYNMNFSTAVVLGARFPFLSPAGCIRDQYFVDGGYFDNSGGGITLDLLEYMARERNKPGDPLYPYLQCVKFKVLYISNGSEGKPAERVHPLLNDLAAPLLTIANTRGEQTEFSNARVLRFMSNFDRAGQKKFNHLHLPMLKTDKQPYPMNWVISMYNLNRMEANLDSINTVEVLGME